jgi:hypothetical protein
MPWPQLLVGWELRPAAVVGKGAAWGKRATRWQIVQRRHHTGDFLQPLDSGIITPCHDLEARD